MVTKNAWNSNLPVEVAKGGTARATLTDRGVLIGRGTAAIDQLAAGSAGQALLSGGAAANPEYSTATYPLTTTSGQVLLSTSNNVIASSANIASSAVGIISMPSQSGFKAYKSADTANLTGDGTYATIICDTEVYDTQAEHNSGTGIWTCTTAGKYLIVVSAGYYNQGASHTAGEVLFYNGATVVGHNQFNPYYNTSPGNTGIITLTAISSFAAGDTLIAYLIVSGGTKTVGMTGNVSSNTTLAMTKLS